MIGAGVVSCVQPTWLSDDNEFLAGFVNHELLSVLGVVVTITMASAANLHLELNRLENTTGEGFREARKATKQYAYLLIALFAAALVIVVIKPIVADTAQLQAMFNGGAILIVVVNILSLLDMTGAVFAIPADRRLKHDKP